MAFATRAGVRMIPSRSGFSPRRASCSRTRPSYTSAFASLAAGVALWNGACAPSVLLTGVLDVVVVGFPEDELGEAARPDNGLEQPPDNDDDVLGGGNHALHERD